MRKSKAGFTLIELLIVVAIIGILAAIAIPNFLEAQTRAKVASAQQELKTVETAIALYRIDRNAYPLDAWDWMNLNAGPNWITNQNHQLFAAPLLALTTPTNYLTSIPDDPFSKNTDQTVGDKPIVGGYAYGTNNGIGDFYHYGEEVLCAILKSRDQNVELDNYGSKWWCMGTNYHYWLGSFGPDKSWDGDIDDCGCGLPDYDPANGTTSRGGIYRLRP